MTTPLVWPTLDGMPDAARGGMSAPPAAPAPAEPSQQAVDEAVAARFAALANIKPADRHAMLMAALRKGTPCAP